MSVCHLCGRTDGHFKRQDGELVCADIYACQRRLRPLQLYRAEMGKDPPPSGDHPLAWQWGWEGSKEERERLRDELLSEPEPPVEVHPEQGELFGEVA